MSEYLFETMWDDDDLENLLSEIKKVVEENWNRKSIADIRVEFDFFPEDDE